MTFHIFHSNRVERLRDHLVAVMQDALPDPLAPEFVLVDNRVLGDWLNLQLAQQQGIAANIRYIQPHQLFWDLARSVLGEQSVPRQTPLSKEEMTWKLYALLGDKKLLSQQSMAPVRHYLESESAGELKRYQLAVSIADLFDQYLVYRPAWIHAWSAGKTVKFNKGGDNAVRSEHWQRLLWQRLDESAASGHRAAIEKQLLEALDADDVRSRLPMQRLFVFGMTAMPPTLVEMLMLLGKQIDVSVSVLNPSEHHWFDIQSEKQLVRLSQKKKLDDHYDIGNPLLASQGIQVKEFLQSIYNNIDRFDLIDDAKFEDPGEDRLLHAVQREILNLQYQGVVATLRPLPDTQALTPVPAGECQTPIQSIHFHDCHSRLREVEVLYEQLMAMFRQDPSLRPRDIVVMMPQVAPYVPYIHSVFAASGQELPYHITDRSWKEEVPLLNTLELLLALPVSRLPLSEVLAILEVPAVQQKFGMDRDGYETLRGWLVEAGARWGLDAAHREQEKLPAYREFSWEFAINRLLAGASMSADRGDIAVTGVPLGEQLPVIPLAGIEGSQTQLLDGFIRFWQTLCHYRDRFRQSLTATQWADCLEQMATDFFGELSEEEMLVLREIRKSFAALREAGRWYEGVLPLAVIQHRVKPAIEQGAQVRHHWREGIKFCSLLPMRGVPFRVIYMLGMNQGDYPRHLEKKSFDLMRHDHKPGDRATRLDDRWLFLEALLSARDILHISYIGRDERKNDKREPSVVVAELQDYLRRGYSINLEAFTTHHRLQPFSRDGVTAGSGNMADHAWLTSVPPAEQIEVDLDEWIRFFTDPPKWFFRDRHGVSLRIEKEIVSDEETVDIAPGLDEWQFKNDILQLAARLAPVSADGLARKQQVLDAIEQQYRASGRWPVGSAGDRIKVEMQEKIDIEWLNAKRAVDLAIRSGSVVLETPAGVLCLKGSVSCQGATVSFHTVSKSSDKHQLAFYLTAAFAGAAFGDIGEAKAIYFNGVKRLDAFNTRNHHALLEMLATLYLRYREHGLPFHPEIQHDFSNIEKLWMSDHDRGIVDDLQSTAYYIDLERLRDPVVATTVKQIDDALKAWEDSGASA